MAMAPPKAGATAPLALTGAAHGEASGWRRREDLIDALPYIDPLTPDIKKQVEALIEEEMRSSRKNPADFLKELPPLQPLKFERNPLLAAEYARVRDNKPMPALDMTRYRLDPPSQAQRNDLAAWRAAIDNAHAQLEHQYNRIQNLELMLKFGPNTWRAQNQLNESLVKQFEGELHNVRRSVDATNRERKLQQTAAGLELRKLEDEWAQLVRKNLEIAVACEKLQDDVDGLRSRVEARQQQNEQQQGGGSGAAAGPSQAAADVGGASEEAQQVLHAEQAGDGAAAEEAAGGAQAAEPMEAD